MDEQQTPSVVPATASQLTAERLRKDCKRCLAVIYEAREELTSEMTPRQLSDKYTEVVQNTARLRTIRNQLYDLSNEIWCEIREKHNSDTSTTRAVEMTEVGRMEKKIKNEIKSAEQIASALRMKRNQAENELKDLL
jgi:t-SNARE complex subunit (syntaxin)